MLVEKLHKYTKLVGMVANPYSMAPVFQAIELHDNFICAQSECGFLFLGLESLGLGDAGIQVKAKEFNAILSTLPEKSEFKLGMKDKSLSWQSGSARGTLSLIDDDAKGEMKLEHDSYPWTPPKDFAEALRLSQSACAAASVSIGLYGIEMRLEEDGIHLVSSNSISLAEALIKDGTEGIIRSLTGNKITLRPPVPNIIAAVLEQYPDTTIDITPDGIFMVNGGQPLIAKLSVSPNLTKELKTVTDRFTKNAHTSKIDAGAVSRFLTRANALVDKHSSTVNIAVEKGNLKLEHKNAASSSEEHFLASGLGAETTFSSVALPIHLLANALKGVDTIILDYLPDKVLILSGSNPNFRYIISGQ